MSSTGLFATEPTIDKDSDYTNLFVNESTPGQEILGKGNGKINSTSENLIQRNWKLITSMLLVL